jgi:hypothetical protein
VVNRVERPDRLEFNQHRVFDRQIGRVRTHDHIFVMDKDVMVLPDHQARITKFVDEGVFIDPFEKSHAECVQNDQ